MVNSCNMKKTIPFFGLILLVLFLMVSCNRGNRKEQKQQAEIQVNVPVFNADSAYAYVAAQVAFGPRVPKTGAHTKCREYLVASLKRFLPDVVVQESQVKAFDGTVLPMKNIIASYKPELKDRIFLSSHWDSRPFADHDPDKKNHRTPIDGANDGASGVGVLMEVARQLSQSPAPIGVDIVFFDVEDYGRPQDIESNDDSGDDWGLGSQYWAKNSHKQDYYARYGVLLDMVGAPNATFLMEGWSMYYAPDVVQKFWSAGQRLGYASYFISQKGGTITDDHYYVNKYKGIPTIDIIHLDQTSSSGFHSTWHTLKDKMDDIDPNTLKAVGQTILEVIYHEQ